MTDKSPTPSKDIQGEGNYDAARKFDAEERAFVKSGQVEQKAKEAEEALDGPDGEELERARKAADERGQMGER
jgi:hypothetical protein